ncbi:unnamed protein product, partial [Polarella glacialis]
VPAKASARDSDGGPGDVAAEDEKKPKEPKEKKPKEPKEPKDEQSKEPKTAREKSRRKSQRRGEAPAGAPDEAGGAASGLAASDGERGGDETRSAPYLKQQKKKGKSKKSGSVTTRAETKDKPSK